MSWEETMEFISRLLAFIGACAIAAATVVLLVLAVTW